MSRRNIFDEKAINDMTAEDLLTTVQLDLWDFEATSRHRLLHLLYQRARAVGVEVPFDKAVSSSFESELQYGVDKCMLSSTDVFPFLETDSKGNVKSTAENFTTILRKDPAFFGICFNELSGMPMQITSEKSQFWTDADDARAKMYIESTYDIYNAGKYNEALNIVLSERRFNPVKDKITMLVWDGKSRITEFLREFMLCEDTPYTREVSRLIFAGGIHRLYNPGCKFDYMPVLIGTSQGEGKSTIVRWLNMSDEYFTEVTEFDGQRGIEALEGAWICEVSELLALTKTKEQEAVKSFLTRLNDRYRMPFDKRVTDHPRQCVFIGTTNKEQFLTDKTGNRRFLPVKVNSTGAYLYAREAEAKAYIEQCWAEAKSLYDKGELMPYADPTLIFKIKEKQSEATEDDYRIGMIESYLKDKKETCVIELWQEALQNFGTKPTKKDSTEIGLIMQGMRDWVRMDKAKRFKEYGIQKYWKLVEYNIEEIL